MSPKLGTARYLELYNAYIELGTVTAAAKACGVRRSEITRYCNRDRWEEKRIKILQEVGEHLAEEKSAEIIETLKNIGKIKTAIIAAIDAGDVRLTAADFDKMVRLERLLQGEPDSRPDGSITLLQIINQMEGKTDEELKAIVDESSNRLSRIIGNGGA